MPDRLILSPPSRKPAILDVIRAARDRIALSLFRANDPDVFAELTAATARGVQVDVLVTSNVKGGKTKLGELWEHLKATGARIHPYGDPVVKYHAKYLVADDGLAIVASLNLTKKCFDRTHDAVVITDDRHVVDSLHRIFDADRQRLPLPGDLSPRLVIGPERARRQLTEFIDNAQTSIRVFDAKLSDPDMLTRLQGRQSSGLDVETVRNKKIAGLKSHAKILSIDGRVAVIGGLALTALSLEFRREIAIVVDDPSAMAQIEELFSAARANAARSPV
ncbi:MAG TPA: phospholipase D-like domain-containing protein [Vicinamibacterales bacterium]|jgi:phosphatidylserine/phosphatidylglycerophosphate/cardiolipin synthase-like enzyme|nr:phospholipase D-like domain-containing protein [Vicinamibacterales bacterium]